MFPNFPVADIPLFPPAASANAPELDALYFFICAVFFAMTGLIFVGIIVFAWKFRRRRGIEPTQIEGSTPLELTWSILPFLVMLIMFAWGGKMFFAQGSPPKDAMEIFVTGKQWMWKIQYPSGGWEINELHVPVGQDIKLSLTSEDVIHSFFVPAFRLKHDVVPGRYNSIWFRPTTPGRYHLFCTEYCGTQHAGMIGWVDVLDKAEYARWAGGRGAQGTLAEKGQTEFGQLGCATCHLMDQQGRCPNLRGLYGKQVQLRDGTTVIADDAYIRESILNPNAKIVAGFQSDIMPVFQGQITEEGIIQVIAYIKSLSPDVPSSQQGSQQWPVVVAPRAAGDTTTKSGVPPNGEPQNSSVPINAPMQGATKER